MNKNELRDKSMRDKPKADLEKASLEKDFDEVNVTEYAEPCELRSG
jgi:hypothetical protein